MLCNSSKWWHDSSFPPYLPLPLPLLISLSRSLFFFFFFSLSRCPWLSLILLLLSDLLIVPMCVFMCRMLVGLCQSVNLTVNWNENNGLTYRMPLLHLFFILSFSQFSMVHTFRIPLVIIIVYTIYICKSVMQ